MTPPAKIVSTILQSILPPVLTGPASRLYRKYRKLQARNALKSAKKLHLGCGDHLLKGWHNVDLEGPAEVIKWDLRKALPVASNSVELIFSEHFIEHIPKKRARKLLQSCHQVLQPGGVLRLSTPDLDVLIAAYQQKRLRDWADVEWLPATPCQMVNEGMRNWGHEFVYNRSELIELLQDCGFTQIESVDWQKSNHPELAALECRPFHQEIILECRKATL